MNDPANVIRETEAKFRVHSPFEMPTLVGERTGAASVDAPREERLNAVYWDTSDLRLAREGVTLRLRSGEGPAKDGWHLKLPIEGGRVPDGGTASREELHASGDAETIPAELRDLVTPWARSAVLGPVATLVTHRTTYLLRDGSGSALVEVTDDVVSVVSSGHVAGRFREIEIEDVGGGSSAIEAAGTVLRASGAVGGEFLPKVVRALGPQATADPDPPLPGPVSLDDPVRCVVRDVLRRNVRALLRHDVEVRRDRPDGVHQMRVSARRLRSALKAFNPLLDPEWAGSLSTELKWLADALAGARDNEVLLERLLAAIDALPEPEVIGPVRARLEKVLGGASMAGNAHALEALRSERYVVLLERLVDAAWEPMTAPEAEEPAAAAVPAVVATTWRRLRKRVRRLDSVHTTDHDWHRVRIAAKQLRYTCDAVESVAGKPARRLSKQAEHIQDILGEHQDAVVAAECIRNQATSRGSGTIAFTLGVLHARQTDAARAARTEFRRAWAQASRSRYRRWLAP